MILGDWSRNRGRRKDGVVFPELWGVSIGVAVMVRRCIYCHQEGADVPQPGNLWYHRWCLANEMEERQRQIEKQREQTETIEPVR